MPKEGFKSITVAEEIYDRFQEVYYANRADLAQRGVRSLSGYVSYMLKAAMDKDETFAKHKPKISLLMNEDDRVILMDNEENRVVEVAQKDGELFCHYCDSAECVHIGFVYSMPDAYGGIIPDKKVEAMETQTASAGRFYGRGSK